MNDIDRYLDQACRSVSGPVTLRQHLREELKEHLEEAVKELVVTGMSQEEAAKTVIEDFGEPSMIRDGLQSVYGYSITSLLIDKAMEWKEKTMKTEWKWNFAAQFGLVSIIALAACFIGAAFMFISPVVQDSYADLGRRVPDYLIALLGVAEGIYGTMWIWVIALAGVIGLFEWKCRSKNKALIRTVIGVGASLVSVALAFWVAAAIVVPLVQVQRPVVDNQSESVVIHKVISAHESYEQLAQAIENDNWPVANVSATELRDAYRILRDMGKAVVVLAGENQWQSFGDIRRLMVEIADFSDELHDAIRDNRERSITLEYFAQLKTSYSQLELNSTFFAAQVDPEARPEITDDEALETEATTVSEPGNTKK